MEDKPFASTGPHGHRGRMRAKLLERGPDALADYELLEMLLFLGTPRGDTKPFAKQLMNHFGSLHGLFAATPEQLAQAGLSRAIRSLVGMVSEAGRRLLRADADDRPHLRDIETIGRHLRQSAGWTGAAEAAATDAGLIVLHLNNRNRLLHEQRLGPELLPEDVVQLALQLHASALVVAALRPGRPRCLPQDRAVLAACRAASAPFNIVLHDFLVVGSKAELSLRQLGLF